MVVRTESLLNHQTLFQQIRRFFCIGIDLELSRTRVHPDNCLDLSFFLLHFPGNRSRIYPNIVVKDFWWANENQKHSEPVGVQDIQTGLEGHCWLTHPDFSSISLAIRRKPLAAYVWPAVANWSNTQSAQVAVK